MLSEMS